MAKLTLTDLSSLENQSTAIAAINANNALIENALEVTLSRDGTTPNTMVADLDMNSNRILNLPTPLTDNEPARLVDVGNALTYSTAAAASATAAASSATSAASSAASVGSSATAAAASASTASAAATSATASATSASTSATQASNSIGAIKWNFETSTVMAAPASGGVRLNNATVASATAIAVNATDASANAVSTIVNTWDDSSTTSDRGTLTIRKLSSATTFAVFSVSGALTDNTTWLQLAVTYIGGSGTFSAADVLSFSFARSGNAGAGSVSGMANHGIPVASSATAIGSSIALTTGQLVVGQTGADPIASSLGFGLAYGTTVGITTTNPPYAASEAINLQLNASVGSSILTIDVKGNNGSAPSATNPVLIPFRDSTVANGGPVWVAVTSALTITTNAIGASLGSTNNVPFRLWVVAFNNSGTPVLGLINCSTSTEIFPLDEAYVQSSTAFSAAATSAGVFYTPNGTTVSSKAFKILGWVSYESGLATAGTYASVPTRIHLFGAGSKKPGDVVRSKSASVINSATSVTGTTIAATTLTVAIAPTSACNPVCLCASGTAEVTNSNNIQYLQFMRGGTAVGPASGLYAGSVTTALISPMAMNYMDAPGTTSSTTYAIGSYNGTGAMSSLFPAALGNSTGGGFIQATEVMG